MTSARLSTLFLILISILHSNAASAKTELCRISKDEDIQIYDKPLRTRNSIILDRESITLELKAQGRTPTEKDLPSVPRPVGVLTERDYFNCDLGKRTAEGEQIIPGPKGSAMYVLLPSYNEVVSREEADKLGEYAYYRPTGKELQVYLDGTPGKITQFFDRPGISWKDAEKNLKNGNLIDPKGPKGVAWPAVGDSTKSYKIVDSAFVPDYYDPVLRTKSGRMFYKVDISTNGKKTATGWVDSLKVRYDELTYIPDQKTAEKPAPKEEEKTQAQAECCKPKEGLEIDKSKIEETFAPLKEYKAPVKPTFGNINELIKNRPCVAKKDKKKELVKKAKKNKHGVGDEFEALAKSAYRNVDNKGVTAADLAAIDMFARTIYGEMRSCHNDLGERYSKAQARIVLNRAIACQRNKKCGFVDKHDNTKDLSESILSVLGQRQQFSVWNSGDSNLDDILCIQKSKVDRDIWEDAVDIASQAVLDTDKFMNVTRSVGENTYHYISLNAAIDYKEPGWAKSKKKVKGIRIDGLPVDKKSCILAYSSKAIANIQQNLNEKYAAIFNLRGDD